ncbi:MAG TPA: hypothetical protein DD727_00445 [Clostridiales bacterium]|nr:hypothetical protein [Clostridiales bacterium]
MFKKLIHQLEFVISVIEALYDKFKDYFKLVFLGLIWWLLSRYIFTAVLKNSEWLLYTGWAVTAVIFAVYKIRRSYTDLLISCAVPFFASILLVFFGDYWTISAAIMIYFYIMFSFYRKYDHLDLHHVVRNRVVFAAFITSFGVMLICTLTLAFAAMPFTILGYYKIKWTIKNYKEGRTRFLRTLRVLFAIPMSISFLLLMFLTAL